MLCNLPDTSISLLQRVQNSLARVVIPSSKRSDHITPILAKLHWLPVKKRIEFKIATITYKYYKINNHHNFLKFWNHINLLGISILPIKSYLLNLMTSALGRRSFSYVAPHIWNMLPDHLRNATSLSSFTSQLKTHFFRV